MLFRYFSFFQFLTQKLSVLGTCHSQISSLHTTVNSWSEVKYLLCPYFESAEGSSACLCSEQGDQLHPCLGANILPAAVAIEKNQRQNCPSFKFLKKNLFKSAGIESGHKFLSRPDAQWVPSTTSLSCCSLKLYPDTASSLLPL